MSPPASPQDFVTPASPSGEEIFRKTQHMVIPANDGRYPLGAMEHPAFLR